MNHLPPPKPRRVRGTAAAAFTNRVALMILGVTGAFGLAYHFLAGPRLLDNLKSKFNIDLMKDKDTKNRYIYATTKDVKSMQEASDSRKLDAGSN